MKKRARRPLISVITVCYNEEKNIEKTCRSVAAQTFKDFEWIVIDGKSTDNTLQIIKKYKSNTDILMSEKDSGIYNAMNKAIKKSKGKYLLFLNGGDSLTGKGILKKVSDLIKKDKEKSQIYYGDLQYDNGDIVSHKNSRLDKKFFIKSTLSHQATFIRRELFSKYGFYDESYRIVADYDFWIKAIIKKKVKTKYIPITVSIFDLAGISTSYKHAKTHVRERTRALLRHNLIGPAGANLIKLKWSLLTLMKRLGLYNIIRKTKNKLKR